jgi:hypothetical protein
MLDRFDGTCERNLTEMLGMEWERDIEAGTSILHQRVFTEKLLKVFGFWQYSKPTVCVFITAGPSTKLFAWGGGILEDMCYYERRRAEACVD